VEIDLIQSLGASETIEEEDLFEHALDLCLEAIGTIQGVLEPAVGAELRDAAGNDFGTEVVRERGNDEDRREIRGHLDPNPRIGVLQFGWDLQFLSDLDRRGVPAERRVGTFTGRRLER